MSRNWAVTSVVTSAIGVVVSLGLLLAISQKKDLATAPANTQVVELSSTAREPHTMHLPYGQKFVGWAPKSLTSGVVYRPITEERLPTEKPRRLTIYKSGSSPGSWDVDLYIQEH